MTNIFKKIKNFIKENRNLRKIIKKQNKTAKYLNKNYIKPYLNNEFSNKLSPVAQFEDEKIIWQYWGQGIGPSTPEIVKTCFNSVGKYKKDYKVIVLTNETIKDYVNFPDFIYEKLNNNESFTYAFFSDLLRMALLSLYGGVWIDATVYLTNTVEDEILKQDFFAYQRTNEKPKNYKLWTKYNRDYFCWDKNYRVRLLSSFIVAKKNNLITDSITQILIEYWKQEKKLKHYFLAHLIFDELMKIKEYSDKNTFSKSDLAPHIMQFNIYEKYDIELWNKINTLSSIHKLTYFTKTQKDSVLEHILNSNMIVNK